MKSYTSDLNQLDACYYVNRCFIGCLHLHLLMCMG
ncbi:unnamed protein product [Schistosoma mattheei]|uniref:Uncharacterized protein n=1 Tax=Schistosoma mattheei TaxID=31246 RepID=A0A3P8DIC9_9TREM|nr:unnamed protein product [Schistosoma mattheei]